MRTMFPNSIRGRLALLTGCLTLVAAFTAMLVISNAAAFQQQLSEIQQISNELKQNADRRADLFKMQSAIKNTFITEEYRPQDYGDYWQYAQQIENFIYAQALKGEDLSMIDEKWRRLNATTELLFAEMQKDEPEWSILSDLSLNEIDPIIAELDSDIHAFYNRDAEILQAQIAEIQENTGFNIIVGQVVFVLLAALLIWSVYEMINISRPLDNLTSAIVAFENKTYQPDLLAEDSARPDEMGELSRAVNAMAESITESNRIKEQFLSAAQRFIPSQYLEFLEKDSIIKVQLGDHVSAEMAVMFSDIRGFTTLSEKMTAQENFNFVNEYLQLVSPIIQEHEGFIVKFLGDGMMAIFPYGAQDAVKAGIDKTEAVQAFNETLKARGFPPIAVGIGIHTGPMMVGMIGEELRMQGDAFSDNVNLTARLEGLNKFYGSSMIISEDVLAQIPPTANFKKRYLGKVIVKGRVNALGLYEIYQGLTPEIITLRETTRPTFEQGIDLYQQARFAEAEKIFNQILELDPADRAVQLYLSACSEYLNKPMPSRWDGTITMDAK